MVHIVIDVAAAWALTAVVLALVLGAVIGLADRRRHRDEAGSLGAAGRPLPERRDERARAGAGARR